MDVILAPKPALTLAAYGLFDQDGQANERVIPYDLVNPLFTDYADKQRHVFVPEGKTASYNISDVFEFPVGTVLVKSFGYGKGEDAYKIETRLLIHKENGWTAAPYVWNAEGTRATYAPVGARRHIKTKSPNGEPLDFTYIVPNANQCKTCHQSGHDITPIGPKARNLNHEGQLETWAKAGIISGLPIDAPILAKAHDKSFPLQARARAYLDINCAHCHKADGSASNSGLWLEWGETSPVRLGVGKHPTAAGRGSGGLTYVIQPGRPDASILAYRINSNEAGIAMPELGRSLIHDEGVALIREWIASMPPEQ